MAGDDGRGGAGDWRSYRQPVSSEFPAAFLPVAPLAIVASPAASRRATMSTCQRTKWAAKSPGNLHASRGSLYS